jgi:hypothetical protein
MSRAAVTFGSFEGVDSNWIIGTALSRPCFNCAWGMILADEEVSWTGIACTSNRKKRQSSLIVQVRKRPELPFMSNPSSTRKFASEDFRAVGRTPGRLFALLATRQREKELRGEGEN